MQEGLTPGQFLMNLRVSRELNGRKAAMKIGITPPLLSRFERDKIKISPKSLAKIVAGYALSKKQEKLLSDLIETGPRPVKNPEIREFRVFYELMRMEKPIREKIAKAVLAYDSVKVG